jgi:hypothetical protein
MIRQAPVSNDKPAGAMVNEQGVSRPKQQNAEI